MDHTRLMHGLHYLAKFIAICVEQRWLLDAIRGAHAIAFVIEVLVDDYVVSIWFIR